MIIEAACTEFSASPFTLFSECILHLYLIFIFVNLCFYHFIFATSIYIQHKLQGTFILNSYRFYSVLCISNVYMNEKYRWTKGRR